MKFYQLNRMDEGGASHSRVYFSNKDDADKAGRGWRRENQSLHFSVEMIDVDPTKQGILKAMNRAAGHAVE
jgi:hypothetical protein